MLFLAGEAGVIDINGTVIVELLTFLVMFGLLARYVYPEIVKQAEARQRAIAEQLAAAEKARAEADAHLKEAQERDRAIQSVRGEVANLVVTATEKVIGETLDANKHKQLIDKAIAEVASGDGSRGRSGS